MSRKSTTNRDQPDGQYRQILLDKRESVLTALGVKAQALAKGDRISEEDQAQRRSKPGPLRPNGFSICSYGRSGSPDRLQLGESNLPLLRRSDRSETPPCPALGEILHGQVPERTTEGPVTD
jgi:hypothetical protein